MLEWLKEHVLLSTGMAIGLPVVMWALKKYVPTYVKSGLEKLLQKMSNPDLKDPNKAKLYGRVAKDLMKVAQYEMGDQSTGEQRMDWVVNQMATYFPKLEKVKDDLKTFLQQIYEDTKVELDECSLYNFQDMMDVFVSLSNGDKLKFYGSLVEPVKKFVADGKDLSLLPEYLLTQLSETEEQKG